MKDQYIEAKHKDMHVRLSRHDFERIKFAAEAEKRSISNYVRNIVMSYIESFDRGDIK